MDQVLFCSISAALSSTATEYEMVMGGRAGPHATEDRRYMIIPSSGTLRNFKIDLDDAPGSGKSYKFTLWLDGAATDLTFTISDSATFGENTSDQVSVVGGQTVSIQIVPTGSPTATIARKTMVFTSSTSAESIIMGNTFGQLLESTADEYHSPQGTISGTNSDEERTKQVCAGTGTIKNFYVLMNGDAGVSPEAYRFTVRKNGASQSLTITITADDRSGNDTSNSFTVAPGDLLSILVEPLNSPTIEPSTAWGLTFVSDTDGESLILAATLVETHVTNTEYIRILGNSPNGPTTTEGSHEMQVQAFTLRDMHIDLVTAPGVGNSYVFTSRVDGGFGSADGNLTVTISGTNTTGSDTSNVDNLSYRDQVNLEIEPISSPTLTRVRSGYLQVPKPSVGSSGNLVPRMVAAGFI